MTCIVGVEYEGGVVLGADSFAGHEGVKCLTGVSKLLQLGPYGIGYTTSFRMGDLLRYSLELLPPTDDDVHRHLVKSVVPAVRDCLKAGGFAETDKGKEEGGIFLIAVRGQLFKIQADYAVLSLQHGYASCGAGLDVALGALASTELLLPNERVIVALEAAARHNPFVSGPFDTIDVKTAP
jgi:hypothetical protein